jgi:outer membrane protein TolC
MKKIILFLIIFVFMPYIALRAEEISLTLDEAIIIALRDNRDVLLKTEDLKKAKEKINEAKGGLFPTLNFTGGWTDTRGYYNKDLAQTTTETSLKQYLYKGGKTINTIEQNRYKFAVSQALLDKTKLETVLNVKKAFYTLLLAGEFAHLNKNIMENTQAHLEVVRTRYQYGQACESDILKIKESLGAVAEAYEASLNQVDASAALLKNLLYLDETVSIKPRSEFNYEPQEVAYDEGFLQAMRLRPEIKQYEAQLNADKKAIEVAKADNRPSIYASWDYYSRSHAVATTVNTRNWNDYNVIGLTFTWPIFDGWATKAKVEQAIIDLKETQLNKEKSIKDIALELKNAYLDLKDAIAKIKSSQDQINLYKDTLLVTQDKYKAGIASSLDLNDVSLGYEVSLFNQKQAIYDYLLAKASFDKATGGSL